MNSRERDALDRYITGNYGEDQFPEDRWTQPQYTVVGFDPETPEPVAVRVEQSWDRHTRSWITLKVDENGYQVGDAAYDGTRPDAEASKAAFIREIREREGKD